MRYLASATAHAGCSRRSLWPLKWKSPIKGTLTPNCARRSRIGATAAAAALVLTVMRTSSEPARARDFTCCAVPSMSSVSVLVIDCTTMGFAPPTRTESIRTAMLWRRCRITVLMRSRQPRGLPDSQAPAAIAPHEYRHVEHLPYSLPHQPLCHPLRLSH